MAEVEANLNKFKEEVGLLIRKRATSKKMVTLAIKKLTKMEDDKILTKSFFKEKFESLNDNISQIKSYDRDILDLMSVFDIEQLDSEYYMSELEKQTEYCFDVSIDLVRFDKYQDDLSQSNVNINPNNSMEQFLDAFSNANVNIYEGKIEALKCDDFDGMGSNKLLYHHFLNKFNNLIGNRTNLTDAVKMTYLVSHLKGYALKMVSSLSINDANYKLALDILSKEFLDKSFIINEYLNNLLDLRLSEGFDNDFLNTRMYINEIRSILIELQGYDLDFLTPNTPGNVLLSNIVYKNLPRAFKAELVHKVNSNYPNLKQLFDNYGDVINTLCSLAKPKRNVAQVEQIKPKTKINVKKSEKVVHSGSLQNFETTVNPGKPKIKDGDNNSDTNKNNICKFCQLKNHPLYRCDKYVFTEDRVARARELNLCTLCAGIGHSADTCFGKDNKLKYNCFLCKSYSHITAFCPRNAKVKPEATNKSVSCLCLSYQQQADRVYMLPTITLQLIKGNKKINIRGILDTGSQRSYIAKDALGEFYDDFDSLFKINFNVQTFIGVQQRQFKQVLLGIKMDGLNVFSMPFLIDDHLSLKYAVSGVNEAIANLKRKGLGLADSSFYQGVDHTQFELKALFGTDILQFLPSFDLVSVMSGSCFKINNKLVPFGNVQNFLNRNQIIELNRKSASSQVSSGELVETVSETVINLITDPIKSYFHPLANILSESDIEYGIEKLFSLESIGIPVDEDHLSSYDEMMVSQFKEGIAFQDGHYQVRLPWIPEKIKEVPSNFGISLNVLKRVYSNLEQKHLVQEYDKVFEDQKAQGIIEQINIPAHNRHDYLYIPHRPIIKSAEQVTTKIRPVFNCSFKLNKNTPSINESSYSGIDLMNSLLKLLMMFRTNNYVVLSDIKQAFLTIRLRDELDKNKFCFLWFKGDQLITYRYNSILFGYTASPFILHFILKHHISKYPNDKCTQILTSNFFVDNLIFTGNNLSEMSQLYQLTYDRMKEGGFVLRSWNSNSDTLKENFKSNNVMVEHGCNFERVLGYQYNLNNDTMHIALIDFRDMANTKRLILSENSKLFDPLGLALPLTVRGKLLIKELWRLKYSWDEPLPVEIVAEWNKLKRDLSLLPEVAFPRQALNEDQSYALNIFCDSSSRCYGFVAYASSQQTNEFLFAKAKVTPANPDKAYSIPTLELLGVILALKCLSSILDAYNNYPFDYINIVVDSQVVLNWLITGETKVKARFVNNRVKDLNTLINTLKCKYKLRFEFHYVRTDLNPADMLTRGLTFKKFAEELEFLLKGPFFLKKDLAQWPKFPLLSLPPELSNFSTLNLNNNNNNNDIININDCSNFNRVMNITRNIFAPFCFKSKEDPYKKALAYWIRKVQSTCFLHEIAFLKDPNKSLNKIPKLVDNLNLFLDKDGLLRSKGRIAKCTYFDYNIHNPIILSRFHHFTSLLVINCHYKVQHLGLDSTLTYLRNQGFWIPKGRMAVKKVLKDCMVCKKINTRAFLYPKYTDLPKHHVRLVTPFLFTGVDFTGHVFVKNEATGNLEKMFILVFTCLNIRAIHLELLPDLGVKNFLLAFQRFCNLYRIPEYFYSDNARTFVKAGNYLKTALESDEFKQELTDNNIKHVKIPVYAAWFGAYWERLIRTIKDCMYKAIGRTKLTYFELLTTLSFIKNAVNSRPLTYRSESNDIEIITPNSFLRLNSNSSLILREDDSTIWTETDQSTLENTLDTQEVIYNKFKELWYEEYLLGLRETGNHLYQQSWDNRIKIDDIVLIKSIVRSRPFWMTGRVIELVMGYDSKIRTVKLKQSNGQEAYHAISNLYPLEISLTHVKKSPEEASRNGSNDNNKNKDASKTVVVRPKRLAAQKCGELIRSKIDDL